MTEDTSGTDDPPRSKVARLIREYGLDGFGAEMEAYWTGDGVERRSLRDLADTFNRRLLERTLLDAGVTALEGEIDEYYTILRGEEVSEAVRIETENRLEAEGVDIEELKSDFVTYQAIRSYLREHRGAEYEERSDEQQIESDRETIERLVNRTIQVTEKTLRRLRDTGRIDLGEFRLLLEPRVLCQDCGSQYTVRELLDRGGCDCDQ